MEAVKDRLDRLAQFGNGITQLLRDGTYAPHPDMGTRAEDMAAMLRSVGVRPGKRGLRDHDSGYSTAVSVYAAALATIGRPRLDPAKCSVAIEGFGEVGKPLARLLEGSGFKVVAVSTRLGAIYNPNGLDVPRLTNLSAKMGSALVDGHPEAERISKAELSELSVELLNPCARHHSLHAENAPRLCCRVVRA